MADQANKVVTTQPPKKKSRLKKLFKWCCILFILFIVVLVVLPMALTATCLTGIVKSQVQKQFGPGADVGKVSFGWTTGISIDSLKVPSAGPHAKVKDRNALELTGVRVKTSVAGFAQAAMTGGEAQTAVEVDKANVYLELHPDGKTNLDMPEGKPNEGKPADTAPAASSSTASSTPSNSSTPASTGEPKPLPCSVLSTVNVKSVDVEVADMTSSTGVVQRTVMKGLHLGVKAHVDKDTSAQVDTLDPKDKTVAFDDLKITQEEPGKPAKLVLGVENPAIVTKLAYAGKLPETAKQAAIKAMAQLHQIEALPTIDVTRVYSDDFDLRGLGVHVSLGPKEKKRLASLEVVGTLKGLHEGQVKLVVTADLGAGQGRLPVTYEINLTKIDISGFVAKKLPTVLPLLSGTEIDATSNKLPSLTFETKGAAETHFDTLDAFQRSPTLKTIASDGTMALGSGSFDGSKILGEFSKAFEKLELKDVLDKATGGDPCRFDGANEIFTVKDGVVTIKELKLTKSGYGLALSGTVDFGGHYVLAIHFDDKMYAKLPKDEAKVLQAVDKAGGMAAEGDLDGSCKIATPPADVLAKAMLEGGALDVLRSKNPKAAAKLDGMLGKAGTSVDKIVNDPKQAAKDTASTQAEKQADKVLDKNKDKIEKTTGVSEDKVKDKLKGLLGGSDDKKDDTKKDDAKPDEKKDDSKPLFKNPFGGG
jgi:hypothetical protein